MHQGFDTIIWGRKMGTPFSRPECPGAIAVLLCVVSFASAATPPIAQVKGGAAIPKPVRAALEIYCFGCHDDASRKGKFSLESLSAEFGGTAAFHDWERTFDKIASGEMPPKKKPQPMAQEREQITDWLRGNLQSASRERQQRDGRAASRRLNRTEYENTLHELLGVPLHVKELLPEDAAPGGFDTISTALAISPAHLVAYQRAADAALDATIVSAPKREFHESFTGREWFDREVKGNRKAVPRGAAAEGEIAVLYHQTRQHWELNVMPAHAAVVPGVYRVQFTGAARNTGGKPLPVRFGWEWMSASTDLRHLIAYRDVPAWKPATIEVLADLPQRPGENRIGVCGYTLPPLPDKKTPRPDWTNAPGLEIHRFEIEGPLGEWPSAGHRLLFGDLPLEPRSSAEARAAGRPVPAEDWKKWGADRFKNNPLVVVSADPHVSAARISRAGERGDGAILHRLRARADGARRAFRRGDALR